MERLNTVATSNLNPSALIHGYYSQNLGPGNDIKGPSCLNRWLITWDGGGSKILSPVTFNLEPHPTSLPHPSMSTTSKVESHFPGLLLKFPRVQT